MPDDLKPGLKAEIGRVYLGNAEVVELLVAATMSGGHVLLEGVPGLGKTVLVRALASALDVRFSRIQFTPDLMPADVTGTNILVEREKGGRGFEFQPGPTVPFGLLAHLAFFLPLSSSRFFRLHQFRKYH